MRATKEQVKTLELDNKMLRLEVDSLKAQLQSKDIALQATKEASEQLSKQLDWMRGPTDSTERVEEAKPGTPVHEELSNELETAKEDAKNAFKSFLSEREELMGLFEELHGVPMSDIAIGGAHLS